LGEGAPDKVNIQFGEEGFGFSFKKGHQFPEACSPFDSGTWNFQTFGEGTVEPVLNGKSPTGSGIQE